MKEVLIGRKKEREILLKALDSGESEMIAVIGRRRVVSCRNGYSPK